MKLNEFAFPFTSPAMPGRGTDALLRVGGGVSYLFHLTDGGEKESKKPHHHAPFFACLLNSRRAVPLPEQVGEVQENAVGIRS
jgi:hypothetical protein